MSFTRGRILRLRRSKRVGSGQPRADRLWFALFTGQRASDVAKMRWSEVSEHGIWVVQKKTKAKLLVPIHPDLRAILEAWPRNGGSILQTRDGENFTSKGFSNFMADKIGKSGLPDRCVTHGLRKAAARRLAEAGCSANEIAANHGPCDFGRGGSVH